VKRRRWLRPAIAAALVLGGVLGLASPAFAHAQLLGTSPASGAVLTSPPAEVVLTFGESVQAPPAAIEVYSAAGQQVRTGPVGHPRGRADQVLVSLPQSMRGTYVVSWRVISADTHPVQGAFSFSVGAPSAENAVGALEQHLLASRHPSRGLGILTGTLRTIVLVAVLTAIGGVALLVGWRAGLRRALVRAILMGAAALAVIATAAAVLAQGPYDAGRPISHAFRSQVLSPVLHSNFGLGAMVRIGSALLLLAGVLWGSAAERRAGSAARRREARASSDPATPTSSSAQQRGGWRRAQHLFPLWLAVALAGCVGLMVSLSLSGHATTGRWEPWAFVVDLVHGGSAAVWVGGLIVLAAVLYGPGSGGDAGELGGLVRRFSTTATWAVALILASGVFQAWRQLGSWKALTTTDYGTILLLKVTVVIATVEAGWFSRRWVARRLLPPAVAPVRPGGPGAATASGRLARSGSQRSRGGGPGPRVPRFRRWLAFEAALAIGVVALTGALIDAAPPQGETAAAASRAFTAHAPVGRDVLSVAVYPLVTGSVHVAVQLTDRASRPVDAFQVTAQLSLPSRRVGPISVPLTHPVTGSWVADNVLLPLAGRWQLQVAVLTDPITEIDRTFNFRIYG
jgi:copper transport protein